jgi:hypothetical protein
LQRAAASADAQHNPAKTKLAALRWHGLAATTTGCPSNPEQLTGEQHDDLSASTQLIKYRLPLTALGRDAAIEQRQNAVNRLELPAAMHTSLAYTGMLLLRSYTVHKLITLAACLLLGACATAPAPQADNSPIATTTLEAIHNTQAIPMPVDAGLLAQSWPISANEPRMNFGTSVSNYRVFSLELIKGENYSLSVNSLCNEPCEGFNKLAVKPRALLLDSNGAVIAKKPSSASTVLGQITLSWDGQAPETGTYYLLVAADNDDTGRTIVIDDSWLNNSPLMSVNVGMSSSPFGKIRAYAKPGNK